MGGLGLAAIAGLLAGDWRRDRRPERRRLGARVTNAAWGVLAAMVVVVVLQLTVTAGG